MDIITRFVNAGWDIEITNNLNYVVITVTKNDQKITVNDVNFSDAKKILCLVNNVELRFKDRV